MIIDINAAYDCAGLRRPIIQTVIWGIIEPFKNNIAIPTPAINEFKNNFSESDKVYYLDEFENPKTDRLFDLTRMVSPYGNSDSSFDITIMESKLWFFHQAKEYINMGYKSKNSSIQEGVRIIPNLSAKEIEIQSNERIINVIILNSTERAIISARNIQSDAFMLSFMAKGIYFAQIMTENTFEVKKIIIQ